MRKLFTAVHESRSRGYKREVLVLMSNVAVAKHVKEQGKDAFFCLIFMCNMILLKENTIIIKLWRSNIKEKYTSSIAYDG